MFFGKFLTYSLAALNRRYQSITCILLKCDNYSGTSAEVLSRPNLWDNKLKVGIVRRSQSTKAVVVYFVLYGIYT